MNTLFLILFVSFAVCLVLTPLARALALRCNLVDKPDGWRKMHERAIPVAGGIAILLSAAVALAAAFSSSIFIKGQFADHDIHLLGLLLGAVVIVAVGVADDMGRLRGRHKLAGQCLAVGIVMMFGLVVRNITLLDWELDLGLLAIPFTAFWLLGTINSLNFLDGMDGLLSSVGIILCLAMTVMAILAGQWLAAFVAVALVGGLCGFLRYNFPPASIFLGDSGSMLIGLVVGVLAIQTSLKGTATIALAAPLAVLTIPAFDTLAAIIRRKLTGRSLYTTDRAHLHHCLLRRGLPRWRVLGYVSCFCMVPVLGGLASLYLDNEWLALGAALVVIATLIATRMFGHAEFLLIKHGVSRFFASFLKTANANNLRQSEVHLQRTVAWKHLLKSLTDCAFELNLKAVCLNVNAPAMQEGYHAQWDRFDDAVDDVAVWRAEIPLELQARTIGYVTVSGFQDAEPLWKKIARLTQLLEDFETSMPRINGRAIHHSQPSQEQELAAPVLDVVGSEAK